MRNSITSSLKVTGAASDRRLEYASGKSVARKDGSQVGILADIGIRTLGLAAIALSAAIFHWLYADIHHHPAAQASIWQLALATVAFLSASVGCGLLAIGRHIHDRIEVAERWRSRL